MKRVLFIDDEVWRLQRGRAIGMLPIQTVWAPNALVALQHLRSGPWDLVLFDHDLAEEHYEGVYEGNAQTGYDVAVQFVRDIIPVVPQRPLCIVHSMNSFGALRIHRVLTEAGLESHQIPFFKFASGEVSLKFD